MTTREIEAAVSMAKRSLIDYCILTQKDYDPNWHHEIIAKRLEEVEGGDCRRLMLFMPPRHGKSELATKKFPAWYLGKNTDREIICCSYSADLAEEFGRTTRDIVDDELHQAVFPNCRLKKRSQSATRWRVGQGRGGFVATGVGGSITGMGANILLIDDPIKNREEAESDTYRRKVWEWYTSTAFTRLEKNGAVVLIMTRWHDDDLAGKLLERDGRKGYFYDTKAGGWIEGGDKVDTTGMREGTWDVVSFPALAIEKEKYREVDDPLWKEKYDRKALEEIKRTIGVRDFSALYQQDPVDKEAQLFKEEWFKAWTVIPKNVRYFTAVDPAISKKKGSDDSVVLTICRDAHDNIYVVEIRAGKWNPSELINEIFQQQKKYNSRVGIESQQYQYSLIHYMKQEQKSRGIYIHVSPVSHYTNKEIRIQGLEPYYINGLIYHPPGGAEKLEEQLRRFPSGKHDDVIDALTLAVYLSTKPTVSSETATKTIGMKWGRDGLPVLN